MKFPIRSLCLSVLFAVRCLAADRAPINPSNYQEPIRVACVGDSITFGSGADPGMSYPDQLQILLGDKWDVRNFGVGARTLLQKGDHPYWIEKAFKQAQDLKPDAVIIMLGTNDTKPENWIHNDEFSSDFKKLVKTFQDLKCQPRVFVCRPCPVPEPGNWGINEANLITELKQIDSLAREMNLDVIDVHAALEAKPELFPDHVHPNTAGAGLIAKAAYKALTGKVPPAEEIRKPVQAQAEVAHPVWELGKNPIDQASIHGNIECVDGVVKLDCANSFAIPASVLGAQNDYTIEFEFRRSPSFKTLPRMEGALRIVSNRDEAAHAGFCLNYFPPAWDMNGGVGNAMGIEVNCYWNGECGGLDGEAFNKYSIVVKDRLASIYRNGLLLAMTGEIKPSQIPLTIGGKGWRGELLPSKGEESPVPEPYELRALKIYDKALSPTGFDRSAEMMRNVSGDGYNMQRAVIKYPSLPRILVIGDSISMGYRGFITEYFRHKAYVDYWVGGAWLDPNSVQGENSKVKTSWTGVLSNGPYDVISWNSMTLHMWTPAQPGRCLESNHADNVSEVIEHIKKTSPGSKLIWIRCTPYTTAVADGPSLVNEAKSERLVKFNKITDEVMTKYGIPEIDLYALCEKNLDKASKDGVHWNGDASKLMADEIIKEIEKSLPKTHKQDVIK